MRISDWSSDVCSSDLLYPELVMRGVHPDVVTDQTSAHDPANGYLPQGWSLDRWFTERERDPAAVAAAAKASMAVQVRAMLAFHQDRKCKRLNSSHYCSSRMPSSA